MRPRALAVAALVGASFAAEPARAQEEAPFSQRGRIVVALDNLGGFVHEDMSEPNSSAPGTGANVWGVFPLSPVARFGVHGFVVGGLSVGGSIMYSDSDRTFLLQQGTTLGVAPRIGYAIPFSPVLALWIRGGITYWDTGLSGGGSEWQLAPGGEAYLVITPVSHFGITIGPWGEFGVAGKVGGQTSFNPGGGSQASPYVDIRMNFFGGTFGILADF